LHAEIFDGDGMNALQALEALGEHMNLQQGELR
jgi:hypothetical protein